MNFDLIGPPRPLIGAVAALASLFALLAGHLLDVEASAAVALVCALARGSGAAATSPLALFAVGGCAALVGAIVAGLFRPRSSLAAAALGGALTVAVMAALPSPHCAQVVRYMIDEPRDDLGLAYDIRRS